MKKINNIIVAITIVSLLLSTSALAATTNAWSGNSTTSSSISDSRLQQAYIDLTEAYTNKNMPMSIDYESFVEEFLKSDDNSIEDYEAKQEAQIDNYEQVNLLDEEQQKEFYKLKESEEMKKSYEKISMETDVSFDDFIKEYILLGSKNIDEYTVTVANMIQAQKSSSGKWYYNTGTALPKSVNYTGTLMSKVNKGDIVYEATGGFGITGHLAIVEGVFYSNTYHQFYIRVIEAISDGVRRGILSNDRYTEKNDTILRPNSSSVTGKKINNAIKFCIGQLGKDYSIDLGHDTSSNEENWYCSELVWAAYKNQGIELEQVQSGYTNEPGVTPHDIYHSSAVNTVSISSSDVSFSDTTTHWAKTYILYVAKNGIMSGTSATLFSPNTNLNRAMAITSIYKLAGTPTNIGSNSFTDVPQSSYYAVPVSWAVTHSITSGTSSTQFSPNNYVTREQLAVFIYKFAIYSSLSTTYNNNALSSFTDASNVSNYALTAMKWAVTKGIMSGTSSTTLSPKSNCTRAQMATILYALIHNLM